MLSIEFFPPRSPSDWDRFPDLVKSLTDSGNIFRLSVTYGAGGSDITASAALVAAAREAAGLPVLAHLTSARQSKEAVLEAAAELRRAGAGGILALRGDPEAGVGAPYQPHPTGFHSTAELVASLKRSGVREIAVSCYPERHPDSPSPDHDFALLKAKVEAGAGAAISQFFYDLDTFWRFRDRAARELPSLKLVAGIMPIVDLARVKRFAAPCGTSIPASTEAFFAKPLESLASRQARAADHALSLMNALQVGGQSNFHLYALNRTEPVRSILANFNPD